MPHRLLLLCCLLSLPSYGQLKLKNQSIFFVDTAGKNIPITRKTTYFDTLGSKISKRAFQKILVQYPEQFYYCHQVDSIKRRIAFLKICRFNPNDYDIYYGKDTFNLSGVGRYFPNFEYKDIFGEIITKEAQKGKVIVAYLWDRQNKGVPHELPELKAIAEEFKDKVLLLSFASDSRVDLRYFLTRHDFGFHVIPVADQYLFRLFDVRHVPVKLVLNRSGKVVYVREGYKGNLSALKKAIIASLAAE